jgi:Lhr-like helicase
LDDKCKWFFKKQGGGCSTHVGHCHLHPKQVIASSTTLDEDKYELVLQQLQMSIPIAAIQALLEKRTDTNYTYKQLTAIFTKAAHTLVLGNISSPAERLMRKLEADPDIYYVVYTAHHSISLLSVCLKETC